VRLLKFTVDIPDDVVGWANGEAVNRQMIAKFMREELRNVGTRYGHKPELGRPQTPGESHEWRGFIFNFVRVIAQKKNTPALGGVDAATYGH
jgi:hypothetical protein